jgi:chromosome partitioning protein
MAVSAPCQKKLPPMVEASGSGHWYGLGRYERGDRRDRRLIHWSKARQRRMRAMLATELARGTEVTLIDAGPRQPLTVWAALPGKPASIDVVTSGGERTILDEIDAAAIKAPFVIIDLEGVASRMTSFAMSQADLVIIPAQEQQQDVTAAIDVIAELHRDMRAQNRQIPNVLLMSRTRIVAKPRTARFIGAQLAKKDIPMLTEEIVERDAFASLFMTGGDLHGLDPCEVNNIDAAIANASAFAAEVVALLEASEISKKEATHGKTRA